MAGNGIKEIFILFGALFAFVLVIGILSERRHTFPGRLMLLILLNLGIYQLISFYLYCRPTEKMFLPPEWNCFLEAAGFMMFFFHGPLHYRYCQSVISVRSPLSNRFWIHFLPGIVFVAVYLPVAHAGIASAIADGGNYPFFPGHDKVYLVSILATVVQFDGYMLVCLKKVIPVVRKYPENSAIFRFMTGTFVMNILFVSFWPIDILLNLNFTDDVRVLTSAYLIALYAINRRHPDQVMLQNVEIERAKYARTQLNGLDVESVSSRLDALMHQSKIFKEKITLENLSLRLGIRPHQLSEILNSHMNTTFSAYINDQKVAESVRLLETRSDLRIIEISLDVGYNSLSVFYQEFKKRRGVSPAEYRRRHSLLQNS
jgi:AraC-like DNA-binding protein